MLSSVVVFVCWGYLFQGSLLELAGVALGLFLGLRGRGEAVFTILSLGAPLVVGTSCALLMVHLFIPWLWRRIAPLLRVWVLPHLLTRLRFYPETVRSAFNDLPLTVSAIPTEHTHGEAAADRSGASSFIDRFAASIGLEAFYHQRSRADERHHRSGNREFFWAKDFNAQATRDKPMPVAYAPGLFTRIVRWCFPSYARQPAGSLVALVDVDQYLSMPHFLIDHVSPVVLYTFQPDHVARVAANYSFTFDANNTVTYYVTGGGKYVHKVWNYSSDVVTVFKTFMRIPYASATYNIDRRKTSLDHELVLLTPIARSFALTSWLVYALVETRSLQRLRVYSPQTGFNRLFISGLDGVFVATGRPDSFCVARVLASVDDTLSSIARTSKYDLSMPQVLSFVDGDRVAAAALLEFHRIGIRDKPDVVCPVPDAVRRYQFDTRNFTPEAKPTLIAFMTPFIHGAFAPDATKQNEVQGIKGRITDVKPPVFVMTPHVAKLIREFVERFIPNRSMHELDPVDDDYVLDAQNKPTQRRILADSECMLPERRAKTFNKKEAYGNVKDPRIITTINGVDKREYSKFIYAFAALFKRQPWYAFGKGPPMVAQRVAHILSGSMMATNTDFSRFDGHGSNLMREVERAALLRAFRPQYHASIIELHRSQYNLAAVGAFGTKYEQGFARASGSPETSLFNSLVNAFVAFCALRGTMRNGSFMDADTAYLALGIYGGDDGITADVDVTAYKRAASMVGQDITVEPVTRGMPGIKFLARVYSPDVWFGDLNTCCDLPRTLSKFHTTVAMRSNVTPVMKLLEKTRCLLLSDRHTPIVGEFCAAVENAYGGEIPYESAAAEASSWLSHSPSQYPNEYADWMEAYAIQSMPEFNLRQFRAWVARARDLDTLMKPPMFMPPPLATSKIDVVVDGEVVSGPKAPVVSARLAKHNDRARKFQELKEAKIKAGTWQERPKETPSQMEARKRKAGTWVEKVSDGGSGISPENSQLDAKADLDFKHTPLLAAAFSGSDTPPPRLAIAPPVIRKPNWQVARVTRKPG